MERYGKISLWNNFKGELKYQPNYLLIISEIKTLEK